MKSIQACLYLAAAAVALAACDSPLETRDHLYDGPDIVEFAPVLPEGVFTRRISVPASSAASMTSTVRVQYISASPLSGPVSGEIAVGSASTAVEGEHFRFSGGASWSIPAGGVSTDVPMELLPGGLQRGESVSLVLELRDGNGFLASANYRQFTIVLSKAAD